MTNTTQPLWLRAAYQFGGEVRANGSARQNPNADERSDIAYYHPAQEWDAMPQEDKDAARAAFRNGAESEAKNHTSSARAGTAPAL